MPIPKEVKKRVKSILDAKGNYHPGLEPSNLFQATSLGYDPDRVDGVLEAFAKIWDATIAKGPYTPTA